MFATAFRIYAMKIKAGFRVALTKYDKEIKTVKQTVNHKLLSKSRNKNEWMEIPHKQLQLLEIQIDKQKLIEKGTDSSKHLFQLLYVLKTKYNSNLLVCSFVSWIDNSQLFYKKFVIVSSIKL